MRNSSHDTQNLSKPIRVWCVCVCVRGMRFLRMLVI